MNAIRSIFTIITLTGFSAQAQTFLDGKFKLALPDRNGQLTWSALGFQPKQMSAKSNGREFGIRGQNAAGLSFLAFLFVFPEQAPMTSAKCRDGVLDPARKENPALKVTTSSEIVAPSGPPIAVVSYTVPKPDRSVIYMVRAFVAAGDLCGDLEFFSSQPISADDSIVKQTLSSYRLDEAYVPQFQDAAVYAQTLFIRRDYKSSAPIFELALEKLRAKPGPDSKAMLRVLTDQAGMSYGMSGQLAKARAIFEKGIADDPDYPMYYYNLACADAEEKNLVAAQKHLRDAFARKTNMTPGEPFADPTKDDSFTPFRSNKEFWKVLEDLQSGKK